MKKKTLLLVNSMSFGGAERVASTLVNAWSSRGDEVILMPTFSGRGECLYPLSPEVRLVYLADLVGNKDRTWSNNLRRLYALRQFIIKERPDVIVSFMVFANVTAVIASMGLRIPVIICEHTDPFAMPKVRPLFWKFACSLTYPLADAVTVLTQGVAVKYASCGLPLRRVTVMPNPIPEQMMNVYPYTNDAVKKRVVGVGRLEDVKQFCVLIRIFAGLTQRYPDWSLYIIGEGSLRTILQQQITDLALEDRIKLVGHKNNMREEFVVTDIFVLTSKYEGFPMGLLEAMAVGLPCVTFDCPSGPREISMDGKVALLVPPNDEDAFKAALERLILDENLRKSLGFKARLSVIERFSLGRILELWDTLFQEVLNK